MSVFAQVGRNSLQLIFFGQICQQVFILFLNHLPSLKVLEIMPAVSAVKLLFPQRLRSPSHKWLDTCIGIVKSVCHPPKIITRLFISCSVQFSRSVMSKSLRPHGLQHTRLPCPSPTPRAYSNSCPLSQWCQSNNLILCHPLLLPSIFLSIRIFSLSQFFTSGGQRNKNCCQLSQDLS